MEDLMEFGRTHGGSRSVLVGMVNLVVGGWLVGYRLVWLALNGLLVCVG